METKNIVGIAKVEQIEDKAEIKSALFDILQNVRQRANIQLPPKAKVMIKVNLCLVKGYETGTSVDPFIARCLVDWLLQEFDPEIIYIGEADAVELNADVAFKALGWNAEFEGMPKTELVNLAKDDCIDASIEKGLLFKNISMSRKYMESDFLISLAKLKTNMRCNVTCILKNQFGITPVKKKSQYHSHLKEAIYDLNLLKLPDLCLVDGIIGMEGWGPVHGIPKPVGLMIVGSDPVATDHACARIMLIPVRSIPPLKLAIKKGLGSTDYEVVGKQIGEVRNRFSKPSPLRKFIGTLFWSNPLDMIPRFTRYPAQGLKNIPTHKVKVGIVGLGAVSQILHLPALSSLDSVEIVAACEKDPLRSERRKKEWGIPVIYEDYEEMYDKTDLDAVFICLPTSFHYEAVKSALEHNLHVFCEKPLGLYSERIYELVTSARERGLVLMVGYGRILSEGYQKAAEIVGSYRLGEILQVHSSFTNEGPYNGWMPRSDWFFNEEGGGPLYDLGSHLFSTIVYVLSDKIKEICGTSASTYRLTGVPDQVSGYYKTEKGVLGTFNIGWRAATETEFIEIIGSAGCLIGDHYSIKESRGGFWPPEKIRNDSVAAFSMMRAQFERLIRKGRLEKFYLLEDKTFIEAVVNGEEPPVSGEDALHVLAVVEAVKKSLETGDRVVVKSYG